MWLCAGYPKYPSVQQMSYLTRWYCVEIADMLRRLVEVAHTRGGVMSIQSEYDAVREAWTHAVLDALAAADETTRLEVARILCPAGFEIVQAEPANGSRH
jgi:hypothetical protein